jgi:hypothetical protein
MPATAAHNCVAIILGAGSFPNAGLPGPPSFEQSAKAFRDYLQASDGFDLPDGHLLDLFDSTDAASGQSIRIIEFLARQPPFVTDVIIYYVGHGYMPGSGLCLSVRETHVKDLEGTSLKARQVSQAIGKTGPRFRAYVFLDCCFSAAAVKDFIDAFTGRGVALLCSANPTAISLAPPGEEYTRFSAALLEVLTRGVADAPSRLSLRQICDATREAVRRISAGDPLPQLHAPDPGDTDIAAVPVFPNAAMRDIGAMAKLLLTLKAGALKRQIASLIEQVRQLQRITATIPTTHSTAEFITHLILEADGSAMVERECSGITATQTIRDLEIPYSMWVSQGSLGEPVVERISGCRHDVCFVAKPGHLGSDRGVDGLIRIAGELSENTGFVGYRIRQEVRHGFYTTREAAEAAYADDLWKGEYFGSITYVRQETMRIIVDFPPQWQSSLSTARPLVFFGESEVLDQDELDQVQQDFRVRGRTATFTVRTPKRGNHYVVAWTPPASA